MFVGDILNITVVRAWEFDSTFPVRSIVPIYLCTAIPLQLVKTLSAWSGRVISWYSVTVAVRLTVALLSLVTDCATMRLAEWAGRLQFGRGPVSAAVVMATSYISLVYYTRTFSNTLETFLFAALLCVVVSRSHKQISDHLSAFVMSTVIVVGAFNRPTFIVYAAVPYLWWLFGDGVHRAMGKAANSVATAVPVSAVLIICDSVYFGNLDINYLNLFDVGDAVSILRRNLTVTPLNFVWYNVQPGNLAEHGIHPRFTHWVVNMPLLFNVLTVYLLYDMFWFLLAAGRKFISMYRRTVMLIMSCSIPVCLLSIFPHQEPRFLIPLLPVLVAVYACEIATRRGMAAFWIVANLAGGLFYGFVHQAGVVPCLGYLQQTQSSAVDRYVIFWHTYTAPQHLLMLSSRTQDRDHTGTTSLTSLEGNSVEDLIHHLVLVGGSRSSRNREKPEVLVAASSSEHRYLVRKTAEAGIRLDLNLSFWPHLSVEHLPNVDDVSCRMSAGNCDADNDDNDDDDDCCDKTLIERIIFLTSLNLYRVAYV